MGVKTPMIHRIGLAVLMLFALPALASAHPHVWVSVKSTIITDKDGIIREVRHVWTFDEPFSSYATLGLDTDKDGKLSREELAALAKVNVESLEEYGYFSYFRKDSEKKREKTAYGPVRDYFLDHDGKALTLHFTVPLANPELSVKEARFEVYDPEFFVSFAYAEKDPVTVEGSAQACTANLAPPKPSVFARLSQLGEGFFEKQGTSAMPAEWSTPVRFNCK
jgi:ABC-type uncharacterized transport system substrate-binding protein